MLNEQVASLPVHLSCSLQRKIKFYFVIFLCYQLSECFARTECGYPGRPANSKVTITYDDSLVQSAQYECTTILIDDVAVRKCQKGSWMGTPPRCAIDASSEFKSQNSNKTENPQTCDWMHSGSSLHFHSNRSHHFHQVTLVSPTPYKDSLRAADLQLKISSNNRNIINGTSGTFSEKSSLVNDNFCIKQWTLNDTGDAVTLSLLTGNVFVCEVLIHVYPVKCGQPEIPLHSEVHSNDTHATYGCVPGFHLNGHPVRHCIKGLWAGNQPTCQPRAEGKLVVPDCSVAKGAAVAVSVTFVIFLCVLIILHCTKRIQWRFKRPRRI